MLVPLRNLEGEIVGDVELRDDIFAAPIHEPVMHQALLRQLANARLGTSDTKTRSEVSGGGKKPWRQKGTGRARQGSIRAPHWRKGGIVFGPHPRSHAQAMPRKMRRLALRSALSVKAADEQIIVVQDLALDEPKAKVMRQVVDNLAGADSAARAQRDGGTVGAQPAGCEDAARALPECARPAYLRLRGHARLGHSGD